MATIENSAYPRLKNMSTADELSEIFLPTHQEQLLMVQNTKGASDSGKLGFIVSLKCYQCLGYPVKPKAVPEQVIDYLIDQLDFKTDYKQFLDYSRSGSRSRHIKVIRTHIGVSADKKLRRLCIKKAALNSAATKEQVIDVVNDIIEELIKSCFELPALTTLERVARAARKVMTYRYYQQITSLLSPESEALIDSLFEMDLNEEGPNTTWSCLKQESKGPATNKVKAFIQHLDRLKNWRNKLPSNLDTIPQHRREQFIDEAVSLDASDMKKLQPVRRYALAIMLINTQLGHALDDIGTIIIRWMRKLKVDAETKRDEYRLKQSKETDTLISLLRDVSISIKHDGPDRERLTAIEGSLAVHGVDAVIAQCDQHMSFAKDDYFPFMLRLYNNKRYVLFQLLAQISLESSSQDNSVIEALGFIKQNRTSHCEELSIDLDVSWLPEKWFKIVTGKNVAQEVTSVHKKYFEMAIFWILAEDLNCCDVYIPGANEFDNPNKQYISWKEFDQGVDNYCDLVGLPANKKEFISLIQKKHTTAAEQVNKSFPENEHLAIQAGEPVLKKIKTKQPSPDTKKIHKLIVERMPKTNIIDVIIDVENWTNLSQIFKPMSGNETKISNYNARFVATSFSYGCNVGPTQASQCIQGFSRKQIAWPFNHHINDRRLNIASERVINFYKQFALPKHWGTGETASVDGTHWGMYTNNLLAEHHLRYGKYGGIGYYHVSDQYIALFSNFIPCGVHEATYIFDGIIGNKSEIQPDTIHGDTGAQSEVIFAFAFLLAIQLMPRIRNFKHLKYYRPVEGAHYKHIDEIFADQKIDWDLIEIHYHDMLRIIMSISSGNLKASTILRKLCSRSRKNKLFFAFRELGRVMRTIFLLDYISDPAMRQMVQAATCKSEEFNNFMQWCRFGDGGVISDNMRFNQSKIIKYGNLLANIVSLHVVATTTTVVNELRAEGMDIPTEVLATSSSYLTGHINRLGVFSVSMARDTRPLEYDLI